MTNSENTGHNMLNITAEQSTAKPFDALMQNEAAMKGLEDLLEKVGPLLAGGRFNRLVDLASVTADAVDMTDAYMIEKMAKAFDDVTGAVWTAGNAARMAQAHVADMKDPPSIMGLWRLAREPEVRRGLAFLFSVAGVLGKGMSTPPLDGTAE
ncbi:DUF1641 domain-containing protein [Paenalcaligenes sp. Me131]|uniref:DUF1641 domain-containing protein n=1 Tax=Paenalcaligenes sp. Me131 TaxID=3392636 RepID=UPI003D2AB4AD